ncbi:MAG: hypothetical protein OXH50_07195 [Gemmatimonadetes bacterium]|nr:hypothetical protein [Gemmatimonadota bacterium]
MSKVRVGIIGAGNIARLHARGYANAPSAELHAVCDAKGGAGPRETGSPARPPHRVAAARGVRPPRARFKER